MKTKKGLQLGRNSTERSSCFGEKREKNSGTSESHHASHQEQSRWLLSPRCKQDRFRCWKGLRRRARLESRQPRTRSSNRTIVELIDESSWTETSVTDACASKTVLESGSRDHEPGKCPKNQEHRSYVAHAMNFTSWCLGSGEMNNTAAKAFGCENLARGRVLLVCGATDTIGRVEAIEAILDEAQGVFGTDPDGASVETNDRPVYTFRDARRKQALSKSE